ncbi:MAG: hypothetical protein ACJAWI_003427, partial [Marinomonas primoryensis]
MLINFLKNYFLVSSDQPLGREEKTFQQSALRILLALTVCIFFISELHSLFIPGELSFLSINSVYLCLLIGLLYFSKKYAKVTAVLFLLTLVTTSFLLLTLSDEFHAEKYALVSLYSLPLITRLLFSFRACLVAMAINVYPFFLMTSDSLNVGQSDLAPSFYFQLLTFVTLNIGLPLAVSRIIQTLESNASHMKVLYRKLNDNYAMYEEFFENTGTPSLLCDQRGKILKANQLARDLISDSKRKYLPDSTITDWLSPLGDTGRFFWQSNVAECTLKQKTNIHIEIRRAALTQHGHYVLHLQNTTQLRAIQQELESTQQTNSRLAHFDLLTLLPNHRHFCHQVNQRIDEQDSHLTGAMFIIRISHFKLLNKQYGKDSANKVILNFSKMLQK